MKTRTYVAILILVFAMMIVVCGCATRKIAISDEELSEAFTGTWVNEEHEGVPGKRSKIILFADGTWERYDDMDSSWHCEGKNTIRDKYKDLKGNIWFECRWECFTHGYSGNALMKISDSGNTLEELYTNHEQYKVEEWDTDNLIYFYRIYYRQE